MNWHVYVLENEAGRRYVGYTGREPKRRLQEHNEGLNRWTRAHGPWRLVYSECYQAKSEALRRERYLKTGAGREERDRLVGGVQG